MQLYVDMETTDPVQSITPHSSGSNVFASGTFTGILEYFDCGLGADCPFYNSVFNNSQCNAGFTNCDPILLQTFSLSGLASGFTDTFNRADGGVGANYTKPTVFSACQIASNKAEPSVSALTCAAVYTAASPALNANQWAEYTLATLNQPTTASFANLGARMSTTANTLYALTVSGPTGSNYLLNIGRIVTGSLTALAATASAILISVGDIFRIAVQDVPNAVLVSAYQNGNLVIEAYDYFGGSITTGNPGFETFVPSGQALTNSQISQFRTGNAAVIYTPVSSDMPTTITITMKDGSTVVVTIPSGLSASQFIQQLKLSGGVNSSAVADSTAGAQWWPYWAWKKALTS